ncbi:uncharacterized protein LOC133039271 [Cannabis sativa]|uniref:uncharacterized protein LOC133039271 n=1 Tax=Cannabis sativa TaxID=3483 RepID=UPI0029C9EFF9|nr:uncharacterized protein LOC133039271 [Cannabis sativa]
MQGIFSNFEGNKKFQWTEKCEEAFQALKTHLGQPPILSKPVTGEVLSIYLAVSEYAISSVLICEDQEQQYPVYYVSKRLLEAETRYPQMEKLAFTLVTSSRKLRPYFKAHSIEVLTNYPLRQVLAKPETSGRLLKWSVELSQFEIKYKPRTAIKGQALADFILEFPSTEVSLINEKINTAIPKGEGWTLYIDGASNSEGLKLALEMRIEYLQAFSDSQIVVCQDNGEHLARGGRLVKYLTIVCELMQKFKKVVVSRVLRAHNSHADALARLPSTREAKLLDVIPVDVLAHSTINREETMEIDIAQEVTWMTPIVAYQEKGILPGGKMEARKLRQRAAPYVIYDGRLYRRSFSQPLLNCIDGEDCDYILCEVHGVICGNHTGGNSLALKIMRQGYYWPTLRQDAFTFAKKCDKCGVKYSVVAVDYFTKWAEAKALATITVTKLREFVYNSIICRFGIPYKLISDNGKQFDCKEMRQLCNDVGIKKAFSTVAYPLSNGQTEVVNKIIKHTIKGKLEERKGVWPDELSQVLWSYNTTPRSTTGETPFLLTYGCEAMVPVEIGAEAIIVRDVFNVEQNEEK